MTARAAAPPDQRHPSDATPRTIYLDNAATTPLCRPAIAAIQRGLELFGNPSSRHAVGQAAHDALDGARADVAALLGCTPAEVVFTGGGSEAINLALRGTFAPLRWRGHLVTTAIEHPAVLETAHALRRLGVEVTIVAPEPSGHVDPERIAAAIRSDTVLVSVMHANNETGAIQPVEQIIALAHEAGTLVHVDAVQTAGKLPIDALAADMVSISAHKFGGPKGVGALRLGAHHTVEPLVSGGGQEGGRRSGTENLPGVLGMAAAANTARVAISDPGYRQRLNELRARLLRQLTDQLDAVHVNGTDPVMAETVSISFDGVRGDTLADILDTHGICVSTGSACHAGQDSASHVLTAMGISEERARSTIRLSFGATTTVADIDAAAEATVTAVRQLRRVAGARNTAAGARP